MHRSPTSPSELGHRDLLVSGGHSVVPVNGRAIALAAFEERDPSVYERTVKPVIDRVGAVLLLIALSPILLATAIAVRVHLGKGVFYVQERVGWKGETFRVYKFRTMLPDRRGTRSPYDGRDRRKRHKGNHDPRHTDFGRWLRDHSLDELPQLFNVLRGELSLVGPRPELVEVVDKYDAWQHRRHAVKPGLTGLWQVTERDDRGEMHLHVDTDLRYVRTLNWRHDAAILLATVPALLGYDGGPMFGLGDLGRDRMSEPSTAQAQRQVA